MAFDGVIIKSVIAELNDCLINGKINKIFEPNKNEILIWRKKLCLEYFYRPC